MTLPLALDRQSNLSLVEQIVGAVARAIEGRTLRPGDALPSVRALARSHAVSPFTVAQAYQGLVESGHLVSRQGAAYRVAGLTPSSVRPAPVWSAPTLAATS